MCCTSTTTSLEFAARYGGPGRGVAQPGRALPSGGRSRKFESCHPDQYFQSVTTDPPMWRVLFFCRLSCKRCSGVARKTGISDHGARRALGTSRRTSCRWAQRHAFRRHASASSTPIDFAEPRAIVHRRTLPRRRYLTRQLDRSG